MQAGRNTTAVVLFAVALALALRIYLTGHHALAWTFLLAAYAVLAVWLRFFEGQP